jgi:hypothetical protein
MKKYFLTAVFITASISIYACSICGCGGGNLYMGLFPYFKNKFIGLRYNYAYYHTNLLNNPTQFSRNYYNSAELYGGVNLGNGWQILAFMPYYYNVQNDDDNGRTTKNGLGDMTVLANYKALDTRFIKNSSDKIQQQLWIGGGIKIPTGNFNVNVNNSNITLADINAQIGTGSWDLFLTARHSIQIGGFGVNSSASFKIATNNNQNFKFGNKLSVNSIAYYRFQKKKIFITPNAGLAFEDVGASYINGTKMILTEGLNSGSFTTGGYNVNLLGGVEVTVKTVTIGVTAQLPVSQDYASKQTKMGFVGMVHMSISL